MGIFIIYHILTSPCLCELCHVSRVHIHHLYYNRLLPLSFLNLYIRLEVRLYKTKLSRELEIRGANVPITRNCPIQVSLKRSSTSHKLTNWDQHNKNYGNRAQFRLLCKISDKIEKQASLPHSNQFITLKYKSSRIFT